MARDIKIRIDGEDSGYKRAASATDRSLDALGAKAKALGDGFSGAGRALLPLSGAITAVGAVAVKFAMDFNRSMANVATLIPGNTARVLELKTTVQDLAVATGKSTQDLSEGLYQVISAFGDTADSAKVLEINAKAAAAGVATTTDAINLTSAVTKAYGDTSAEAVQQVSDLAFQAVKLGQTSFPELAASIGRVTAMSTELSVEQEELFGVMATFTGVTGKAAEVSTQLRGVLQALQSPTDKMKTLFGELGVESGKALIEQRGLQGAIEAVVGEVKSSGGDLKDYIGSLEGQTLALSATGAMADTFTEKLGAMSDAVGATDEAFKEQTEGVNAAGFAWESFKQQVAVAAQNLGDELIPILVDAAKQMKPLGEAALDVIEKFKELPDPVKTAGVAIAVTFAAGAPAMLAMGAMANSVATLIRLYRTLAVVQVGGAAAGGLGLAGGVGVAAGVGAGVVGIGLLSADVENYIKQLEAAAEKERESARSSAAYADGLRSVIAAADPAATLISELSDAQKKAIVSAGTFDGTLGGLKLSLEQVKEGAKGATPPIRALTDAEKAHAKAIQDLSDTYTGQALAAKARDLTAAYVLAENQERLNAASTRAFAEEAMKLARGPLGPAALPERLHELWRAHVLLTNEVKSGTDAFDGLLDTLPRVEHLAQPIPPALGEIEGMIGDVRLVLKDFKADLAKPPKIQVSEWAREMERLGDVIVSAFAGGGNVGRAIGSQLGQMVGKQIGQSIAKAIPNALGSAIGSFFGPAGAVGGGLIGSAIGFIFGDKELPERRRVREMSDPALVAERQQASIDAAIENARLIRESVISDMGDIIGGLEQMAKTGETLPEGFWKTAEALAEFGYLTDEQIGKMRELEEAIANQGPSYEDVKAAAERYGLTIDDLGNKARQLRINSDAKQLSADWDILSGVADNLGVVMDAMQPKVQALVDDALKYGLTLPASMEPMVRAMIEAGRLTDENGDKLTDLAKLTFAETLEGKINDLIEVLKEFVTTLKESVKPALDDIGNTVIRPRIAPEWDDPGPPPGWTDPDTGHTPDPSSPSGAASGGYVSHYGIQRFGLGGWVRPMGTDTVPAMLTPGEGVLSRRGMANLSALNSGRGFGGGSGAQTIVVQVGDDILVEKTVRGMPRYLKLIGAN